MRVDGYTKVVLTVIAACLLVLTARSLFRVEPAHAQYGRTVDVNISKVGGEAIQTAVVGGAKGALPVTTGVSITGSAVPLVVKTSAY